MEYTKKKTYIVTSHESLTLRTKASDDGLEVSKLKYGSHVYCKSYTIDDRHDTWIRTNEGWVRAICNNRVLIG